MPTDREFAFLTRLHLSKEAQAQAKLNEIVAQMEFVRFSDLLTAKDDRLRCESGGTVDVQWLLLLHLLLRWHVWQSE